MRSVNDFVTMVPAVVTDSRLVVDILVPGFDSDDITVRSAVVNGGETFVIKVAGKYARRTNGNGEVIAKLGFEKRVSDFKFEISADDGSFAGDKLSTGDYDLSTLAYSVDKGVLRITVNKTAAAMGEIVKPSDNVDEKSDADATVATDSNE